MTPPDPTRQRAEAMLDRLEDCCNAHRHTCRAKYHPKEFREANLRVVRETLQAEAQAAREAERARCARIAQDHALCSNPAASIGGIVYETSRAIAKTIRETP